MNRFAIFSKIDGAIIRICTCTKETIEAHPLDAGEDFIGAVPIGITDSTHKVVDGVFVEIPPPVAPTEALIAAAAQQEANEEARAYLASTDWYIVRFAESGVAVPSEITTARAAARASIA